MKTKKTVTLHHSAISRENLYEQFNIIQKNHIAKGWGNIGYHYFIEPSGQRKKGRPENMDGAHCYGHNKDNIGICLGGNFSKEYPMKEQEIDLSALLMELRTRYIIKIKHHRDFKATQCPGNLLDTNWHKDLISNTKKMTNVKLLKFEDEISFCLPATNPEALKAMAKHYGIEIPLDEKGGVDWTKMKYDYEIKSA